MQNEFKATVHPLYAVPLMQTLLPDHAQLNPQLIELFLQMESEGGRHRDHERRDTQYGIFESHFFLHEHPAAPIQQLFARVRDALHLFVQGINQFSEQQMQAIVLDMHSWFHVTRTGGFQGAHNHANASWSAIYCVDPGDSDAPESGAVRFHDPRNGCNMHLDPANSHMQIPYRIGSWNLNHKPGQLLVFPSYLVHEVFPYLGQRPRIVVALNAWCRQPGTPAPKA